MAFSREWFTCVVNGDLFRPFFGPVSVYPPKGGLILEAATFMNDLGLEKDCCAGIAVT